ncbi:unnamed protein product [Cylindrotheca closterium]|uniref:Uncharacterized protein n=1 Tax=Cylindrotheca closterium TaxID=2856 RepID=A0AAD2G7A8_9STRA|nr:unnamed protein product [Cylindrotheca closterium]
MLARKRKLESTPPSSANMFDSGMMMESIIKKPSSHKMRRDCSYYDQDESFQETPQPLEERVTVSIVLQQESHHQRRPNFVFDHLVECLYQFDKISEPSWYQIGKWNRKEFQELFFLPNQRVLDTLCASGLVELCSTGELRFKRVATEALQAKIPSCEFMLPECWQRVCYLRIGSAKSCNNRERVTSLSHQMKLRLPRPEFLSALQMFRSQYAKATIDSDGKRDSVPTAIACGKEARKLRDITNELSQMEIQPKKIRAPITLPVLP